MYSTAAEIWAKAYELNIRASRRAQKRLGELGLAWIKLSTSGLSFYAPETKPSEMSLDKLRDHKNEFSWGEETFTLRRATKHDADNLKNMYDSENMLDTEDRRHRFFASINNPGDNFIESSKLNHDDSLDFGAETYAIFNEDNQPLAEATGVLYDGTLDVAYMVGKPYRHNGTNKELGREALILPLISRLIDIAARNDEVKNIHADVMIENKKSADILSYIINQHPEFETVNVVNDDGYLSVDAIKSSN